MKVNFKNVIEWSDSFCEKEKAEVMHKVVDINLEIEKLRMRYPYLNFELLDFSIPLC